MGKAVRQWQPTFKTTWQILSLLCSTELGTTCVCTCVCVCVCVWCACCVCVVLALLLCINYSIILYYFKGMYDCVYVFVLCCIIVVCYCYITALHYMRRLQGISVDLSPTNTILTTDWLIDWTWKSCQLVPLEQPQGLVTAVPVSQHSFHREDLVDPSLGQNYPPVLFQTVTTMRNKASVLGKKSPWWRLFQSVTTLFTENKDQWKLPTCFVPDNHNHEKQGFSPWWKSPWWRLFQPFLTLSTKSPWYNCNGWLGVKHQVTSLLSTKNKDPITDVVELPTCFVPVNHNSVRKNQGPNPSEKSAWWWQLPLFPTRTKTQSFDLVDTIHLVLCSSQPWLLPQ